ncbi:hypothetical protein SSX86_010272 [Deinandra increscens subsp. villosa]|uniref:SAP domain-containing protein n=1 Tax=Deinandra increscens subsp. villosa TaxID=3103831 RepID=A0AAP0D8P1_9ASTR
MDGPATPSKNPNGASKFLLDLPSKGLFSSPVISSNLGGLRVYVTDHDTSPPESQLIKTDQVNILIRSLLLKQQKGGPTAKGAKSVGANENSRKRAPERAADGRASAKRAASTTQNEGSKTKLPENLQSLTVERLRALLKDRGLSVRGKKDELIGRLRSTTGSASSSAANPLILVYVDSEFVTCYVHMDVAARVVEKFHQQNGSSGYDDIFNFNDYDNTQFSSVPAGENVHTISQPKDENDCDHDDEFEFAVVCDSPTISADEILWPQCPLFDRSLLLDVDPNQTNVVNDTTETDCKSLPLWKLFSEDRYFSGNLLRVEAEYTRVTWKVKYSKEPDNPTKSCKARGSDLRCHFKNTRETAHAIRKLPLIKAKRYLEDVLVHKQAIPFTRFCRGVGRTAQAKNRHSNGQGRWPAKSAKFILDLLKNAESNAEVKGLDVDSLHISHIQVNQAQKQRRRTYRAHGRINPYMSSPCHIELTLSEKEEPVKKELSKAHGAQGKPWD